MIWRVTLANTNNRTVDVTGAGRVLRGVTVPITTPVPDIGSEVTIDEVTESVICVVNLNRYKADGRSEDLDTNVMEDLRTNAGDFTYKIPGQGFFGVAKKFRAWMGSRTTHIAISGIKHLLSITADNVNFGSENGNVTMSLTTSEDKDGPVALSAKLGDSINFSIDTATKNMHFTIFDMLNFHFTPSKLSAYVVNQMTGERVELVNEDFKEKAEKIADGMVQDVIKFKNRLKVSMAKDVGAKFTKIKLVGAELLVEGSKQMSLTAGKLLIKGSDQVSINSNTVKVDLSDKGITPGSFQINNGLLSHFRMDGDIRLFSQKDGIYLNGMGDNIVSHLYLDFILTILFSYLTLQATYLGMLYPLSPINAAWQTANGIIQTMKPNLKNSMLHTNIPPIPPIKNGPPEGI